MEINIHNALTTLAPNIITAALLGSHKGQFTTLMTEAKADGMGSSSCCCFFFSRLTPSITSMDLKKHLFCHLRSSEECCGRVVRSYQSRSFATWMRYVLCNCTSVIVMCIFLLLWHPDFYQDVTYTYFSFIQEPSSPSPVMVSHNAVSPLLCTTQRIHRDWGDGHPSCPLKP